MKGLKGALACCLLALTSLVQAETILVVAPVDSRMTREFVGELGEARPAASIHLYLLGTQDAPQSASMVVTMGPDALAWRLEQKGEEPTIATYINSERARRMALEPLPGHVQILLNNPAPARQIELARLILPRMRSLGLLFSASSEPQLAQWQSAALAAGMELRPVRIDAPRELGRGVAELLDISDVLMALDDPEIYNADNLKTLLLSSYRRSKVLVGPGPAFIPAGSLSTTFSTAPDTAASVAYLLDEPWVPGRISYPRYFSVSSNQHVARSLGLPPLDDAALAQAIRLMKVSQ